MSETSDPKDFRDQLLKGFWHDLKDQLERGALIIVNPSLQLHDVGTSVTLDEVSRIQDLITRHLIGKPSPEQIAAWNLEPTKEFYFLIVQPYVLIQEIGVN